MQNKKFNLSIIALIIVSVLSIIYILHLTLAAAQTPDDVIQNQVGINPENLPSPENLDELKSKYLQQEWGKIIINKPVIGSIHKFLLSINPLFKAILGVEYSLSWAFAFAIIIWFCLFKLLYPPASQLFGNKWSGFLGAFIISSLIGLSGVIKKAVDMLSFVIKNQWLVWVSLLIAILFVFLFDYFGKSIKKYMKQEKEQSKKEQTEQDRQVLHAQANVAKQELKSYKNK